MQPFAGMDDRPAPQVHELPGDECRRLLRGGITGCIGLAGPAAPTLRPVNYVLDGEFVVIRTGEGRILEAGRGGEAASFAVHSVDAMEHTGWSVLVVGKLAALPTDARTLGLPLRAWASGQKDRFVALSLDDVSGLRIPAGRGNR